MADLVSRIPADEIEQCQSWSMPDVGDDAGSTDKVIPGVTQKTSLKKNRQKSAADNNSKDNENNEEAVVDESIDESLVKPLTADELEKITKEAEQDGYDQGYKKGFDQAKDDGYKEGMDEAKMKVAEECQRLSQITQALLIPFENQQIELEKQVLDMVCTLTKAVVEREMITDSSHIAELVSQSLAQLPASQKGLNLYLNSQDIELVQSSLTDTPENLQYQVDDELLPGGCRLENTQSSLDDSVERRLQEILDGFIHKRFVDDPSEQGQQQQKDDKSSPDDAVKEEEKSTPTQSSPTKSPAPTNETVSKKDDHEPE